MPRRTTRSPDDLVDETDARVLTAYKAETGLDILSHVCRDTPNILVPPKQHSRHRPRLSLTPRMMITRLPTCRTRRTPRLIPLPHSRLRLSTPPRLLFFTLHKPIETISLPYAQPPSGNEMFDPGLDSAV